MTITLLIMYILCYDGFVSSYKVIIMSRTATRKRTTSSNTNTNTPVNTRGSTGEIKEKTRLDILEEQLEAELAAEQQGQLEIGAITPYTKGDLVSNDDSDVDEGEIIDPEDTFSYDEVGTDTAERLKECKTLIYASVVKSIEAIIEIGNQFIAARNLISHRTFRKWVETEFANAEIGLSYSKVNRFMLVANAYNTYPQYRDALKKMQLSTIYRLFTGTTPDSLIEMVIEKVESGETVTQHDIQDMRQQVRHEYRKVILEESKIDERAKNLLVDTNIPEDKKQVKAITRLSKQKQVQVAQMIARGEAKNAKQAIKLITEVKEPPLVSYADIIETKQHEVTTTRRYSSWSDIPYESVDLLIAECPLKYDFMVNPDGMDKLSHVAHNILKPGGFMIATVGHKAILEAANHLSGLKGLHALCIRRQPGNSSSIIGTNIMSASILAVLAYKYPFRPPANMIVDFQTVDSGNAIIPETDIIESGIEECFKRFIYALFREEQTLAHFEVSKNREERFGIRDYLETLSIKLKAKEFIID